MLIKGVRMLISQSGVKHSAKQVSEMTNLRNDIMSLRFVIYE